MLARGEWLDATTSTRPIDLSLRFNGIHVTLSSLDYPGEIFTDVFYHNRVDSPDREYLYYQLQTTMGAILLVDPEQIVGDRDGKQRLDVQFTGIEVAERLRSRGMAEHLIVVLTKRNQNKVLVEDQGGPSAFVEKHLPRFAEAAPDVPVFHVSAIGTRIDDSFDRLPTTDNFDSAQVLAPLSTLLQRIDPLYLELLQQVDREAIAAANATDILFRSQSEGPSPSRVAEDTA